MATITAHIKSVQVRRVGSVMPVAPYKVYPACGMEWRISQIVISGPVVKNTLLLDVMSLAQLLSMAKCASPDGQNATPNATPDKS